MTNRVTVSKLLEGGKRLTTTEIAAQSGLSFHVVQETIGSMAQAGLLKAHPVRYAITRKGRLALERKMTERSKRVRVYRSTRAQTVVNPAISGRIPNSVFALGGLSA